LGHLKGILVPDRFLVFDWAQTCPLALPWHFLTCWGVHSFGSPLRLFGFRQPVVFLLILFSLLIATLRSFPPVFYIEN